MKSDLTYRAAQAGPYSHATLDANFQRLMYWSGAWAAGTYEQYETVEHQGTTYIATAATTSAEPGTNADWEQITSRVYVQDAVPASPRIGDWHITQTDVPPKAFLWTGSQWLNFITQ